jgi:hypothetical protein
MSTIASSLFGSGKSSRPCTYHKKIVIEFHDLISLFFTKKGTGTHTRRQEADGRREEGKNLLVLKLKSFENYRFILRACLTLTKGIVLG